MERVLIPIERSGSNYACMWEFGGMKSDGDGEAQVLCNVDGSKPEAIHIRRNNPCGDHALIPIRKYMYVVYARTGGGRELPKISDYRIAQILDLEKREGGLEVAVCNEVQLNERIQMAVESAVTKANWLNCDEVMFAVERK